MTPTPEHREEAERLVADMGVYTPSLYGAAGDAIARALTACASAARATAIAEVREAVLDHLRGAAQAHEVSHFQEEAAMLECLVMTVGDVIDVVGGCVHGEPFKRIAATREPVVCGHPSPRQNDHAGANYLVCLDCGATSEDGEIWSKP